MLVGLSVSGALRFAKTIGAETNHPFKAATRYGSTKEASFAFQQKTEQEWSMEGIPNADSRMNVWTRPWKDCGFVVSWIWSMPAENLIYFEDGMPFFENDKKSFFHSVHQMEPQRIGLYAGFLAVLSF